MLCCEKQIVNAHLNHTKHGAVASALGRAPVLSWGRPDVPHVRCPMVAAHGPMFVFRLCFFEPRSFYMGPREKGSLGRSFLFLPPVGFSSF